MPVRTFRDISTMRQSPTPRALHTHGRLRQRIARSLARAPYSTREPRRARGSASAGLGRESFRHVVRARGVPASLRLQVAQLRRLGLR